eukprot:SAG22_NODE_7906_length_698_cov_2.717863_1_plen_47_part_00
MTTYLDLLPDDLYIKIYEDMFEEIANFEMEIYKIMKIVIETIEKNI